MKKLLTVVLVLVSSACGGPPVDRTGRVAGLLALAPDAAAGAQVYTDTFAGCHGADGKGAMARGVVADVAALSAGELATIALNGTGLMGAAGASLTDQQVADLAGWMKANLK